MLIIPAFTTACSIIVMILAPETRPLLAGVKQGLLTTKFYRPSR